MAKPNWGKHVPPKWLDGTAMSNSSWQKWVFPKKSEQGKWLNTHNEQDFLGFQRQFQGYLSTRFITLALQHKTKTGLSFR